MAFSGERRGSRRSVPRVRGAAGGTPAASHQDHVQADGVAFGRCNARLDRTTNMSGSPSRSHHPRARSASDLSELELALFDPYCLSWPIAAPAQPRPTRGCCRPARISNVGLVRPSCEPQLAQPTGHASFPLASSASPGSGTSRLRDLEREPPSAPTTDPVASRTPFAEPSPVTFSV